MASADQWRWTDEDGVQRLLPADELRIALQQGRLKPGTLVWKRGMRSWVPAASVPELANGPESITRQRAPDGTADGVRPRPSNMVDIAALQARQAGGSRPDTRTLVGVGNEPSAVARAGAVGPILPAPPRLPAIDDPGAPPSGSAMQSRRPATTNIDGLWADGAARRDDQEETVTRVRPDEEERSKPATVPLSEAKRGGSVPPPPPRRSSPPSSRGAGSRPPPPPSRGRRLISRASTTAHTLASEQDRAGVASTRGASPEARAGRSGAREVLSAGLPVARPRAPELHFGPAEDNVQINVGQADPPTVAAQPGAASRHVYPTGPLPEMRPAELPRMPEPRFASEPWRVDLPPAAPRSPVEPKGPDPLMLPDVPRVADASPNLGDGALRQALIPTEVPPARGRGLLSARKTVLAVAGGGALLVALLAFVMGRATAPPEPGASRPVRARTGWATVPLFARARATPPPTPRPCLMLRAPSRWSQSADKSVDIALVPTGNGKIAAGYAHKPREPRGLVIDPDSGVIGDRYEPAAETAEDLASVVPLPTREGIEYAATLVNQGDMIGSQWVAGRPPVLFGLAGRQLMRLERGEAKPSVLWELPKPGRKLWVATLGEAGLGVAYNAGDSVWYGHVRADGKVGHEAQIVAGSGGKVGKPVAAFNGAEVSVVFADIPPGEKRAQLRWAHGPYDRPLPKAAVQPLPAGGPGGDAISPSIAGLGDGRWLLLWTEGARGERALRAQTFDRRYQPIGSALRVSPETGDFGQGVVGVVGGSAVVAFLLKTGESYQLWGTVLQCR